MIRTCKKCGEEKDYINDFYVSKTKDGNVYRKHSCKVCCRKTSKTYQKKNFTEIKRRSKITGNKRYYGYIYDLKKRHKSYGFSLDIFDIDRSYLEAELSKPCSYCKEDGIKMTIDRKDSKKGYTKDNTIGCCIRCNIIKNNMPYEAWKNIVPIIENTRMMGLFGDWIGPRLGLSQEDKERLA